MIRKRFLVWAARSVTSSNKFSKEKNFEIRTRTSRTHSTCSNTKTIIIDCCRAKWIIFLIFHGRHVQLVTCKTKCQFLARRVVRTHRSLKTLTKNRNFFWLARCCTKLLWKNVRADLWCSWWVCLVHYNLGIVFFSHSTGEIFVSPAEAVALFMHHAGGVSIMGSSQHPRQILAHTHTSNQPRRVSYQKFSVSVWQGFGPFCADKISQIVFLTIWRPVRTKYELSKRLTVPFRPRFWDTFWHLKESEPPHDPQEVKWSKCSEVDMALQQESFFNVVFLSDLVDARPVWKFQGQAMCQVRSPWGLPRPLKMRTLIVNIQGLSLRSALAMTDTPRNFSGTSNVINALWLLGRL